MLSAVQRFLLQQRRGLPEEGTLFFWEDQLAIVLQLAFLASLVVEFLSKRISTRRSVALSSRKNDYPGSLKVALSYRCTLLCCSALLGTHLPGLLLLLLGKEGKPKSTLTVLLSETTQLLSWLLATLAVLNFQKTKMLRLPWTLRLWWVFGFFQSSSVISRRRYPELQEHNGVMSFLPSSYLFCVSIRGSTGVSFFTGTISVPLLHREIEKKDPDDNRLSLCNGNIHPAGDLHLAQPPVCKRKQEAIRTG